MLQAEAVWLFFSTCSGLSNISKGCSTKTCFCNQWDTTQPVNGAHKNNWWLSYRVQKYMLGPFAANKGEDAESIQAYETIHCGAIPLALHLLVCASRTRHQVAYGCMRCACYMSWQSSDSELLRCLYVCCVPARIVLVRFVGWPYLCVFWFVWANSRTLV